IQNRPTLVIHYVSYISDVDIRNIQTLPTRRSSDLNNAKLEEKYNNWKTKFAIIENETIPLVNDMLIDASFAADKSKPIDIYKKIDRKSTRLNSSHVSISYAVFCLKKKNKKKI